MGQARLLRHALVVMSACTLALTGCGSGTGSDSASQKIVVGSSNFPENALLMNIYARALEAKGLKVETKPNLGSREVVFPALSRGDLTLVPEYTNSLLSYLTKGKPQATNVAAQVSELQAKLPATLTVLNPSSAEDKDIIACNQATASKYSLKTLDDLGKASKDIVLGGPPEFVTRSPFGLPGLKQAYGIEPKQFKALDEAGPLTVSALQSKDVDCANLFSTGSAIAKNDFVPLTDSKGLVPAEAVFPLIDKKAAASSNVVSALDAVDTRLTTDVLVGLVAKVEIDKIDSSKVATDWLRSEHLI